MPEAQTLNSRLRLLIAKSFRAEKLYSSLRNVDGARLSNPGSLSDIANDVRSKEWQKSHAELRTSLNDILADTSPGQLPRAIALLREKFLQRYCDDRAAVEKGIELITETALREEFAHVLKLSVEFVKLKARSQASKAISDELTAVLAAGGFLDSDTVTKAQEQAKETAAEMPRNEPLQRGNVIALRQRR